MIESLYIENFAIIDQVQIDFQSGMTVLTGETGAGKSIIIDAIGQLIGQRSQPSFVKNGADYAFIEGVFSSNKEIDKILLDNNFPIDEHLVISKKINHDGKSAIKINYRNSSQLLLKKIMSQIVDIHSNFETHQLFNESYHLKLLDNFIGNELIDLKKYKETLVFYESPHRIKKTLNLMLDILGDRNIALCREITKKHEEIIRGHISEIISIVEELKGEMVIVVEGSQEVEEEITFETTIKEDVDMYIEKGMSTKDAIKEVAKQRNLNKNSVYQEYHSK